MSIGIFGLKAQVEVISEKIIQELTSLRVLHAKRITKYKLVSLAGMQFS